jgi:probable rRNA maturation factor
MERAEISLLLTDDGEIREMNRSYRGYDKATDVLSFAQCDPVADVPALPGVKGVPLLLGDIVISVDTAVRQATTHDVTLEQELALLAVHGLLHLIGYEDETESGAARMREREREILGIELK